MISFVLLLLPNKTSQSEPVVHIVDVLKACTENFSAVEKSVGVVKRFLFTVGDDCQFC